MLKLFLFNFDPRALKVKLPLKGSKANTSGYGEGNNLSSLLVAQFSIPRDSFKSLQIYKTAFGNVVGSAFSSLATY